MPGKHARQSLCLVASLGNLRGKGDKFAERVALDLSPSCFAVVSPDPQARVLHDRQGTLTLVQESAIYLYHPSVCRLVVALAAGSDTPLLATDFAQASHAAPEDNPHMYCELPELPPELEGGDLGAGMTGKGARF